jgi:hypothetical protein
MGDIFPVPADRDYLYGEYTCSMCGLETIGWHHTLEIDFTKPGRTGVPESDRDTAPAGEYCEPCWEEHAAPVQHWYEHAYLPEKYT